MSDVDLADAYLTLLRDALQHTLYRPIDAAPLAPHVVDFYQRTGLPQHVAGLAPGDEVGPELMRSLGLDNPVYALTMLSTARLDSLRALIETVLDEGGDGDLLEAGVWRGGASIFMKGVLSARGAHDRRLVLADSFEGLPATDTDRFPEDAAFTDEEVGRFGVGLDEVRANFERFGLLDENVEFVVGWFRDTMPTLRDRRWSVLRLDGDLYQSTIECLENLYDGLAPGGIVIIDDYVVEPCKRAVHDYRDAHAITEPIETPDWASAYWRKG